MNTFWSELVRMWYIGEIAQPTLLMPLHMGSMEALWQGPAATLLLDWDRAPCLGHRTAPSILPLLSFFFFSRLLACLSVTLPCSPLAQRLTLLSLSDVSRWFASTHCHPSVRPWPIKLAQAPISLLQLRWLFLDSIPPLISSSEISLRGGKGLGVVGCLGGWRGQLRGRDGLRREEARGCMLRSNAYWVSWLHDSTLALPPPSHR